MPTQLITETKDWIDSHLTPANTLTITSELLGDIISDSIEKVFANPSIEIDEVTVSVADDAVTISGKSKFGAGTLSITVEIKDVDDKYVVEILFPEMQTPADIASGLSDIWEQFDLPEFFTGFQIAGIEFPSIEQSFSVIAEQNEPLGLADDKIVIGPSARIKFQVTNLSSASIEFLAAFSAPISIGSIKFRLTGELSTDDAVDSKLTIEPIAPAEYPSLGDLVEIFLGAGVQIPDGLTIADLQLGDFFQKDAFTLSMRFNETWTLALGPAGLTVQDISITVVWAEDNLTGVLRGTVTIAGFDVEINSNLLEQLTLSGKLPSIKITSLIESIAGPVFSLPSGFPEIELPDADFSIPPMADPLSFLLRTAAGDYGTVWLLITKIDGEWQAAVVFVLADDWKFSRLSALLAPLDQLPISKPMLTLASFSEPEFSFPEIDGAVLQAALLEGVALNSDLILKGFGLDFVRLLIGQEELPLLLTVGDSLANAEVRVKIDGSIDIVPGVIVFNRFALEIDPDPFAIALAATAEVEIFGQELPEFRVSVGIEEGSTEIELVTIEPWENPLGISGLTINKVALQMKTSPVPQYGILGEIAVSDKVIMMAAQFTGTAPSMIAGELQGTLSLQEVVQDLVGLSLPGGILDISITDFKIHVSTNPTSVTIAGETFESGLTVEGIIGFFGLEIESKVIVNPNEGVFVHAALKEEINLGGILIISNADGNGPASFTLDTRRAPFLKISGRYSLLGIGESINAVVDTNGIEVAVRGDFGPAHYEWGCRVKSLNNFEASGSCRFALTGSVGPLRLAPGTPSLGKFKIDTGFQGEASVAIINDQFKGSVRGKFNFQGNKLTIPEFELSVVPASLEEFPDIVWQQLKNNAKDIFADFLTDADKWLLALRDGLVEGVEQVAQVLRDQFNRTSEQIGRDIRDTLNMGSAAAAQGLKEIGEGVQQVADVLNKLGEPQNIVKDALQQAGFPSDEVSKALQISFNIPHLDVAARGHIDTPLTPHGDMPLTPHGDTRLTPHGDTPLTPHGDTRLTPHGDTRLTPHGDTRLTPHGDIPSYGHADFRVGHVDFRRRFIHGDVGGVHTDTAATPHLDIPRVGHLDIRRVGHLDIRRVGHVDIRRVGHLDIRRVGHLDIPSVGHVDVPTVGHADSPAVPHIDSP